MDSSCPPPLSLPSFLLPPSMSSPSLPPSLPRNYNYPFLFTGITRVMQGVECTVLIGAWSLHGTGKGREGREEERGWVSLIFTDTRLPPSPSLLSSPCALVLVHLPYASGVHLLPLSSPLAQLWYGSPLPTTPSLSFHKCPRFLYIFCRKCFQPIELISFLLTYRLWRTQYRTASQGYHGSEWRRCWSVGRHHSTCNLATGMTSTISLFRSAVLPSYRPTY